MRKEGGRALGASGALSDLSAALVALAGVPLTILQVPDLIALAEPAALPGAPASAVMELN